MVSKAVFEDALKQEGVTGKLAQIARSVFKQESGSGENTKTSNAGAVGGMQIVPSTFKQVADKDWKIDDPLHNSRAGIRYLKEGFEKSGGDAALTGAFYYGGPGGLEKAKKGIAVSDPRNPKAPTTLEYGAQVASRIGEPTTSVSSVAKQLPQAANGLGREPVNGPVIVPPELPTDGPPVVAQAPVEAPVQAQAMPPQVDAWQSFLAAVGAQPQQVTPEMLDFGSYKPVQPMPDFMAMAQYAQPVASVNTKVAAFSPWKGLI